MGAQAFLYTEANRGEVVRSINFRPALAFYLVFLAYQELDPLVSQSITGLGVPKSGRKQVTVLNRLID